MVRSAHSEICPANASVCSAGWSAVTVRAKDTRDAPAVGEIPNARPISVPHGASGQTSPDLAAPIRGVTGGLERGQVGLPGCAQGALHLLPGGDPVDQLRRRELLGRR